jgi:hypothetical protein
VNAAEQFTSKVYLTSVWDGKVTCGREASGTPRLSRDDASQGGIGMTKQSLKSIVLILAAGVSACGGGSGSGGGTVVVPPTSSTPPPSPPSSTGCSLVNRQNFAASVLNEWYLFLKLCRRL